ncbi:MAG: nitrite/sulfite reductase [Nitrospinaceae bacterium]|jgi:sulfite reductase (ferredoxin)|nr:nitrite/sulfite reductase [Nitrospinaceae bacterium]MBT4093856.1 nitrite/sulfite reductase [Nitrospinaceae bacterium]MBT5947797.1 nitrite/sulfite reductase [Nitrospinaceae bacterium]MBT6393420.1 nitrite/sulfite reductase [Nitrospinaceae bacterium]MBT7856579.1 nitrite/sulfite reductase [Nitrospinaceae bacterium]
MTAHSAPFVDETKPMSVIPILPEEFDDFETEATRFRNGDIDEKAFMGYRLKRGVYGQRQNDVQMVRVKLPFGGVRAEQLEALGQVARDFAPLGKGHVTTRENVQFHFIPLEQATEILRILGNAGLSTREACGNCVRNVTGSPYAGVGKDEVFDPTPYAGAFARYFVRKPLVQDLPRKWKVAFSSTAGDDVLAGIHDMGFLPVIRNIDGEQVKGFRILVGGGLATLPRPAEELYDFVPVSDYLRISEALVRVFNDSKELRKTRFKARIKFLVSWIGIDGVRGRVEEELKKEWAQEPIDPTPYLWLDDEEADMPAAALPMNGASPNGDSWAFSVWRDKNVIEQRQPGFHAVEVKLPIGDIEADQFFSLAEISRRYSRGRARTSFEQNIIFRWVREEDLYPLWRALVNAGLGDAGAREISSILSCPGTDSCKLGITSSMGLGKELIKTIDEMNIDDPLIREMHIKMSGCPNSCGQHHLGNIGFHGGTLRAEGKMLPAYEVFLGGEYENTGGSTRLGDRISVRLPAKRVPEGLKKILALYLNERNERERFNTYYERVGQAPFEAALAEFHVAGQFGDDPDLFLDWSKSEPYVLERGEGECMS